MPVKYLLFTLTMFAASAVYAIPTTGGLSWSTEGDSAFSFDTVANDVTFGAGPNAEVNAVSGDFMSFFAVDDVGTFHSFNYSSGGFNLWSATGTVDNTTAFSFFAETVSPELEQSDLLVLAGTGFLSDGTDTAAGTWNITANSAGGTFSWSGSNALTPSEVPEPSTIALLGAGLLGLGLMRRRRSA